jgi:hypothetical protein
MLYEGLNTCASCCELLYTCNRPEWHLGDELVETPQSSVWSCPTASESFDQFNRLAVALAKSQDHRALCGVFAFGLPRCGTSVVKARDTLHTSGPKQGRWAESRAGWCTNSLDDANATGGSMLGNVAGEAKRGAVTVGLRFAQGFTSWGLRKRWT